MYEKEKKTNENRRMYIFVKEVKKGMAKVADKVKGVARDTDGWNTTINVR